MTAVTEQFGRDSHIIMGAVIDESLQNQVEVCVLGTTEIGGRGVVARRPVAAQKPKTSTSLPSFPFEEQPRTATTTTATTAPSAQTAGKAAASNSQPKPKTDQEELFAFGEIESRGFFDKTDRNLFEGQDLDVPTYLRKGIKISI
jgi:cell division protein FtsZ